LITSLHHGYGWTCVGFVVDSLRPLIWEMAPEMDNEKRMTRIYGDEDDGI
jgi:hypothetical protein